jgi:hypothetical protein
MRKCLSSLIVVVAGAGLAMSSRAEAYTIDTTTLGNWVGVYGGDGYEIPYYDGLNASNLSFASPPSYITGFAGPGYGSYSPTNNSAVGTNAGQYDDANTPNARLEDPSADNTNTTEGAYNASTVGGNSDQQVGFTLTADKSFLFSYYEPFTGGGNATFTLYQDGVAIDSPLAVTGEGILGSKDWYKYSLSGVTGDTFVLAMQSNDQGEAFTPLIYTFGSSASSVPEPASLSILGLGSLALLGRRRRAC